ncbi:MAG: hypothetical protein MJE77_11425 [Proteobacteria bacterium]|nr:hypothetical protein [Pseudomonadota bacterium]
MRVWFYAVTISTLFAVSACGGDTSPAEACSDLDDVACEKILQCYTAEQLMQLGVSNADECIAAREDDRMRRTGLTCSQFTEQENDCDSGEKYNTDKASSCRDTIESLSCEDWLVTPRPGDCTLICETTQ